MGRVQDTNECKVTVMIYWASRRAQTISRCLGTDPRQLDMHTVGKKGYWRRFWGSTRGTAVGSDSGVSLMPCLTSSRESRLNSKEASYRHRARRNFSCNVM